MVPLAREVVGAHTLRTRPHTPLHRLLVSERTKVAWGVVNAWSKALGAHGFDRVYTLLGSRAVTVSEMLAEATYPLGVLDMWEVVTPLHVATTTISLLELLLSKAPDLARSLQDRLIKFDSRYARSSVDPTFTGGNRAPKPIGVLANDDRDAVMSAYGGASAAASVVSGGTRGAGGRGRRRRGSIGNSTVGGASVSSSMGGRSRAGAGGRRGTRASTMSSVQGARSAYGGGGESTSGRRRRRRRRRPSMEDEPGQQQQQSHTISLRVRARDSPVASVGFGMGNSSVGVVAVAAALGCESLLVG